MSQPNVSSGLIVIPIALVADAFWHATTSRTDTAGAATARRILPQRSRDSSSRPAKRDELRPSDIPLLVEHFLDKYSNDAARRVSHVTPEALAWLVQYTWPGNVRELGNAIQFGMIKCHSDTLDSHHLPPEIVAGSLEKTGTKAGGPPKLDVGEVADALCRAAGNRAQAARLLEVSRTTLYRFLETHPVLQNTEV